MNAAIKLQAIVLVSFAMAAVQPLSERITSMMLVERFLGTLMLASVTEMLVKKHRIQCDFGPLTYLISLVHPCMFPLAGVILHSKTNSIPLYKEFQSLILGSEYKARYRGSPNFREVHSEHRASTHITAVAAETRKAFVIKETIILGCFALGLSLMHGFGGMLVALACYGMYYITQMQGSSDEIVRTKDVTPIQERQGVYAIETSSLWSEHHVGVGYLANGTFTTKMHVTNAQPIFIGDRFYKPCYYNTKADIVCYGAPPAITNVSNGDSIVVALSGPYSDVILTYRTEAVVNSDGYVIFTGRKSVPGTSGSPFFRAVYNEDNEVSYEFAGCLGWTTKTDGVAPNEITEIAMNTSVSVDHKGIKRGEVIQHFSHPGSGKTRNIPNLIQQGLNLYGKVNVVGPTRGVSYELVTAYEDNPIENVSPRVLIKDVKTKRAPSPLIITTHATSLGMLLKKDSSICRPALWIIDEAHFPDKATQCLKYYLRDNIIKGKLHSSLYEMTATGYDVKTKQWMYCDGSNHPIKDTIMSKSKMLDAISQDSRKIIVFVTSIKGSERTSSQSLANSLKAQGKRVIEINRGNFSHSYPRAKTGEFDVILTTNISECGVNLDVEACYDFQESPKPLVYDVNDIAVRSSPITRSSVIQRRGRVGRTREGEYIAPKGIHELPNMILTDAMYLDIAFFLREFDVDPLEHIPMQDTIQGQTLTHEQIMYLFARGEEAAVNSFMTLQVVLNDRGELRSSDEIISYMSAWTKENEVTRSNLGTTVSAKFWDDRDSDFYWSWKRLFDMEEEGTDPDNTTMKNIRKFVFNLGRTMKHRGVWLRTNKLKLQEVEYEVTDEDTSADESASQSGQVATESP